MMICADVPSFIGLGGGRSAHCNVGTCLQKLWFQKPGLLLDFDECSLSPFGYHPSP